ncbi:MAG: hypothetical protein B7Y43_03930 [Sphingomonas sp. 28-62-20]|uniref:hypothetical protein n=1 Tax=Sphingomonas sp. 28-62-20 TaxID=1970433 RepID=UPI000BCF2ADC|nr:MAG: hypothetical protein B7Y43_03930 [Sphingomonas sp. 28-62-20]
MINRVLCAGLLAAVSTMAWGAEAPHTARVVLKFVKANGASGPAVTFVPESCPACRIGNDAGYTAENDRETSVELIVPLRRTLELRFAQRRNAVRRVILESGDIPFEATKDGLTLTLPPLTSDAVTAAEFSTHLVEPGTVLRFEHADRARRAGAYAEGDFPDRQRAAANVLTFAQREVIRAIGLGSYVAAEKIGTIELMGFDTNFPHGHRDAPPHMHMHLRWPTYAGTQIAHYYIDARGLLERNEVGVQMVGHQSRIYGKGESFTTVDLFGRPVYVHTITPEGWLTLGRAGVAPCLIRPQTGGFDSGAIVDCPGQPPAAISVADDPSGRLTVRTNDIVETFRYDADTGALLSPIAPPAVAPSGYPPLP